MRLKISWQIPTSASIGTPFFRPQYLNFSKANFYEWINIMNMHIVQWFLLRGHSTTTWTDFCHFFDPILPLILSTYLLNDPQYRFLQCCRHWWLRKRSKGVLSFLFGKHWTDIKRFLYKSALLAFARWAHFFHFGAHAETILIQKKPFSLHNLLHYKNSK